MTDQEQHPDSNHLTRREFLKCSLAGAALTAAGLWAWRYWDQPSLASLLSRRVAETCIIKATNYQADLSVLLLAGLRQLGVTAEEIRGKSILLKPNLVETKPGAIHVNTHPAVVRAAVEAFLHQGAARVLVAEGVGHRRDTLCILEESGLADVLHEDRIPFKDLNYDDVYTVPNSLKFSRLSHLTLPETLRQVDWLVSLAKLKTHHWAGVTLSMKNLFGVMPGSYYGWPKNVLHQAGIPACILDITATVRPHFAIVDGIVGMEGDGPIMGTPKPAGVLVMGRNLPAVDATCARLMGINPQKVPYLAAAAGRLGPIRETRILQMGESIAAVRTDFALLDFIPAHRGLRLT